MIEREIGAVLELGIDAELSFRVGHDATIEELLGRHGALFLAVGTGRGRDLDLPGHELDGILRAVEFLLNVNRGYRADLGQRVVVVGGGNVAFDAARTALRAQAGDPERAEPTAPAPLAGTPEDARRGMTTTLDVARAAIRAGVLDVTVIALESPEEIPADPEEIAEAEAEGIEILYRKGPHRFVGADGRVTGLETIDVRSVFDDEGRFNPTFVPDTYAVLPADTVILAVGQAADLQVLAGVELELSRGCIQVDPITMRTSHARIWAGGDVAHGPRNLIDAVADGQRAAAAIHAELAGVAAPPGGVHVELHRRPTFRRLSTSYDAIERQPVPATPSCAPDRLRRGRGRLRRRRRLAAVAPLPSLLRQRDARTEPLHPVRPVRGRLPDELHHDRPSRRAWVSARRRRACCCSARICASAVGSA